MIFNRIGALGLGLALLVAPVGGARAQDPTEIAFWSMVKESQRAADIRAYLEAYPRGAYAEAARRRLTDLERAPPPPPSPGPGPSRPQPGPAGPSTPGDTRPALGDETVIREVQERLYNLNYDVYTINGRLTEETRTAIREWQTNTRRPATGDMNVEELAALRNARLPVVWGGLAYAARGASAVVWNRTSRRQAANDAITDCRSRNQGNDCKVITAAEKACGALGFYMGNVRSTTYWGAYAIIRPTIGQATAEALKQCREQAKAPEACGIRLTFCADGSHQQ